MYWPPLIDTVEPLMKPAVSAARKNAARLAKATHGNKRKNALLHHVRRNGIQHLGVDVTRTDGIPRDAGPGRFPAPRRG
jgi:hypothetical protein